MEEFVGDKPSSDRDHSNTFDKFPPVAPNTQPNGETRCNIERAIISTPSKEHLGVIMVDTSSPLSPYWSNPTLHKEVDTLSNRKSEIHVNDSSVQNIQEGIGTTSCVPTIEKGKQLLFDVDEQVNVRESDNASKIIVLADSAAPSYDLGISPPKLNNEDAGLKQIDKQRKKRLGEKLRSPYVQRCVSFDVTNDEAAIQDWVMKGVGGSMEMLFMSKTAKTITRTAFQSLAGQSTVCSHVIDGWAAILNDDEKLRSTDSPRRHFFDTEVSRDPIINNDKLDDKKRYECFRKHLERSANRDQNIVSMKDVDLS